VRGWSPREERARRARRDDAERRGHKRVRREEARGRRGRGGKRARGEEGRRDHERVTAREERESEPGETMRE